MNNSLEALKRLMKYANIQEARLMVKYGYSALNDIEIIKQDLDRLEQLEKENASLHTKVESMSSETEKIFKEFLDKENQRVKKELKQTKLNFKNSQIHSKNCYKKLKDKYLKIEEENKKLKEIIKENFDYTKLIRVVFFNGCTPKFKKSDKDFLIEVLENA